MKEEIIAALRIKYKTQISEKQIESLADYLAITVTEETQIETAVNGVENLVKASQGEADKVRTEAAKAKKELEDKLKALTGANPEPEPPKTDDSVPSWAKVLIDSNNELKSKLQAIEGEKTVNGRQSQLNKAIESLPEKLRSPYARISLDKFSDEEFTTYLTEITSEVETISSELTAKGAVFSPPSGGNSSAATGVKKLSESEAKEFNKYFK